jgi:outer membrane lipoprotein-sorting protein
LRRFSHSLLLLCSLFIALVPVGCARAPGARPGVYGPTPLTAEELVVRIQEQSNALQTMKAQLSIVATGKEIKGTQKMEAALVYQRPNLIRLWTFARIGYPLFDLVLIEDRYQVKIPLQGKILRGSVADLGRQEGLGAPIMLGVQATLGNLNGTAVLPDDHLTLRQEEGQYVLEVLPSDGRMSVARRLWFDQNTLDLVRQDFLGPLGETQATIIFQDYRLVGPGELGRSGSIARPYLVRAEDVRGKAKLELTFHEIVPNPKLSPQDWGMAGEEPL